jgi:hypothetical protein
MDRQCYLILSSLYYEVMNRQIDNETYKRLLPSIKFDRRPANIEYIRDIILSQKIAENRETIALFDNSITANNETSLSDKSILIISIIKNIEPTFDNVYNFINNIRVTFDNVNFYFISNNNTDNTWSLLSNFIDDNYKQFNGKFIDDFLYDADTKQSYLAMLLNLCYQEARDYFKIEYDYLLVLDSNISTPINLHSFRDSFKLDREWDIICGNRTFNKSPYHSDVLSLRLIDEEIDPNIKFKHISKFDGRSLCWIDKLYNFVSWYKVKSAYGGIMVLNKKIFDLEKPWNEDQKIYECPHLSLCLKFNDIYVNPDLNFQHEKSISDVVYEESLAFVPRDAGFFSVFNYLMGMIKSGYRVYPYFNESKFIEMNKLLQHFSYMGDGIENSWFNFFEPIKYHSTDTIHTLSDLSLLNTSQGEKGPIEFKVPYHTGKLYQSSYFPIWRKEVHKFYKKYIVIKPEIVSKLNKIISDFPTKNMIAVLYRHPAHSCEHHNAKPILFADYFNKIDIILEDNPDALIYLATDTELGIAAFTGRYGDKVLYDRESGRTSLDNIIEWGIARGTGKIDSLGFIKDKGYEYHNQCCSKKNNTEHGINIIVNTMCLAACRWFIFPGSNISLAVSYINPDIEMIYVTN